MPGESLIIAGWVLVSPAPRPAYGESLPENILTISDCIQEDLPRPEFWDWYIDLAEADRARRQEAPHSQLITVAMAVEDADEFMIDVEGDAAQPFECFDLLRQHLPLDDDLTILGFELVGAESYLDFHSWHCHGYADDVASVLDIHTNHYGLLLTRTDSRAALTWMLARPPEEAPTCVPWTVVALAVASPPSK